MALTRARTTKNRTMGVKLETTTGTYIAPIAADAAFIAIDPSIVYDKTLERIMAQGSAAPTRSSPGLKTAAVKVSTYLIGQGEAMTLPKVVELLMCSGFKNIGDPGTPSLIPLGSTDAGNTATVAMWTDGLLKSATGCSFKWKITGEVGKPVKVEFDGKGVRKTAPSDAAQVFGAAPALLPPILVNAAFSIGGTPICVPSFEIEGGGSVEFRPCANDATGIVAAQFFPDVTTMKTPPDAQLLAAINWYTKYQDATEMAFTVTIGSVGGNQIVITGPALQLTGDPEDTDASGILRHALEFQFNAVTGNDQIMIDFINEE